MTRKTTGLILLALALLLSAFAFSGCGIIEDFNLQELEELGNEISNLGEAFNGLENIEGLDELENIEGLDGIDNSEGQEGLPDENGSYTSKDDVALYIHIYGRLPDNFITKSEAQALGWEGGGLDEFAPGKCIGGDRFGNYEGLLPDDREYTECDIDTLGMDSRGAKRIVFSGDGLIYYTDDHYESFTLLYGEV